MAIRTLLVDNQAFIRQGLAMFLSTDSAFEVVDEANNGHEAIEAATRLLPDVILMDLFMPELDGIAATEVIRSQHPAMSIIALSHSTDYVTISSAIEAGIDTYLFKGNQSEHLITTIKDVLAGKVILSRNVRNRVLPLMRQPVGDLNALSAEERSIVQMLLDQKSNADMAHLLGKDIPAIDRTIGQLQQRWGARTRLLLILRALQAGLIEDIPVD